MKVLHTSIAALITPHYTATPTPAYGDEAATPLGSDPSGALDVFSTVDGEVPADFSALGKEEVKPEPEVAPELEKKVEPEKPIEGAADKTKVEPEKKVEATETKTESKVPKDDTDVDKIEAHQNAPTNIKTGIAVLKEQTKIARAEARSLATERETLQARVKELEGKQTELPADVKAKLDEMDRLQARVLAENDPKFIEEWKGKISGSEETLYGYLKSHGLGDDTIAEMKAAGGPEFWQGNDKVDWDKIATALGAIDWTKANTYLSRVISTRDEHGQAVKARQEDGQKYISENIQNEESGRQAWGKDLENEVGRLGDLPEHAWSVKREVPANATPEQKKLVDDHNARMDAVGKEFAEAAAKVHGRDHKTIANHLYRSFKLDHVDSELKSKIAELETAQARIAELEDGIAKRKAAGKVAHTTPSATKVAEVKNEAADEGDAFDSVSNYWKNKS